MERFRLRHQRPTSIPSIPHFARPQTPTAPSIVLIPFLQRFQLDFLDDFGPLELGLELMHFFRLFEQHLVLVVVVEFELADQLLLLHGLLLEDVVFLFEAMSRGFELGALVEELVVVVLVPQLRRSFVEGLLALFHFGVAVFGEGLDGPDEGGLLFLL